MLAILYLDIVILATLAAASCIIVPVTYVFVVQKALETFRFHFIESSEQIIYYAIHYACISSIMGFTRIITAVLVGRLMYKLYKLIHNFIFKYVYLTSINKNYDLIECLKSAENLIIVSRLFFSLWLPAIFDALAVILYMFFINKKISIIIFGFYCVQSVIALLVFRISSNLQNKFYYYEKRYKVSISAVIRNSLINKYYNLYGIHYLEATKSIQNNAINYKNVVYGLFCIEGICTVLNGFWFSILVVITNFFLQYCVNKAVLFSLLSNSYVSLWKALRNFINMYDIVMSINLNFLNLKVQDNKKINVTNKQICINNKTKTFTFTTGLNVLMGPSGTGKTSLLNQIMDKFSLGIFVTQGEYLFEYHTIQENIIGSLNYDEEIMNKSLSTFKHSILNNIEKKCCNISGGESKLISYVRAKYYIEYHKKYYQKFEYILLDEPFNHIDKTQKQYLIDDILYLVNEGYIIILVDHSCNLEKSDIKNIIPHYINE